MKKSTITYRLNQDEFQKISSDRKDHVISLEQDEYEVVEDSQTSYQRGEIYDQQPLNQFTTDFGGWSSPFDVEVDKLEKMIRESNGMNNQEASDGEKSSRHDASYNNEKEYDYDPVTGYYHHENYTNGNDYTSGNDQKIYTTRYLRHSKTPWVKIISSVSGAIITGVLFGVFVLTLFSDDSGTIPTTDDTGSNQHPEIITENEQPNPLTDDSVIAPENDLSQMGMIQVDIPAQSFFILQNGVFRNEEGAAEAQKNLINKGFSAAKEISDGHYVFAGISTNRDDALFMSHQLQQHDFETYIKTYSLPAIRQIYWKDNHSNGIETFISEGNRLVKMVSNLTQIYLQKSSPQAIENSSLESVLAVHQTWNGLASQVDQGMPDEFSPTFQKLNNALTTAIQSLTTYNKNPSFSYLWQSQTGLMEYILLQKELLMKLTVK